MRVCVCKSAMLSFACHTVMQTVTGSFPWSRKMHPEARSSMAPDTLTAFIQLFW